MNESYSFWNQLVKACEKENKSPNKVTKELGISSSVMTNYKNGRMPTGDMLIKLSEHLHVSVYFLLSNMDADVDLDISKKRGDGFKTYLWLTQRWASIRFGKPIIDEERIEIAKFTNSNLDFIYGLPNVEYSPKKGHIYNSSSLNTLELIFSILDRVDNNNNLWGLGVQLSKIVKYWLNEKGITGDIMIKNRNDYRSVSIDKIRFIFDIETYKIHDSAFKCGFNFSELDSIRENIKIELIYMFTGKTYEELFDDKDKKIAELEDANSKKDMQIAELKERISLLESNSHI